MNSRSPQYLKVLGLYFRMLELQDDALDIDHCDPLHWDYPPDKRGRPQNGGILWSRIDTIHGQILRILDA